LPRSDWPKGTRREVEGPKFPCPPAMAYEGVNKGGRVPVETEYRKVGVLEGGEPRDSGNVNLENGMLRQKMSGRKTQFESTRGQRLRGGENPSKKGKSKIK